jgi:hypothetical protein
MYILIFVYIMNNGTARNGQIKVEMQPGFTSQATCQTALNQLTGTFQTQGVADRVLKAACEKQ